MIDVYWTRFSVRNRQKRESEHEAGRALLRYILLNDKKFNQMPDIVTDDYGKPYLKDYPMTFFNITHCDGIAACAVGGVPLGIDAECVRPVNSALVRRVLSANEQVELNQLGEKEQGVRFIEYWTLKECYLKAKGIGLRMEPKQVEFQIHESQEPVCQDQDFFCSSFCLDEKCILSVCGFGTRQEITLKEMDYSRL